MSVLSLFPARIRFVNQDGTLTPEALRMLELLVQRVGGALGDVGADVFASPDAQEYTPGGDVAVQPVEADDGPADMIAQPQQAALAAPEMLMQPLTQQLSADQVDGLGTMATQNVGTNFSGSFTGKTVAVTNGIITSVI
jgi:hypothetical protein